MSKVFVIFGATGQHGGAVIDFILQHETFSKEFSLRGITRNASMQQAIQLKARGVGVIEADMNDPPSLRAALEGEYAVFAMTNFWDKACAEAEIAQGKTIADASLAAGVSLMIWSSLPDVTKMSKGQLTTVEHFDSKAEVEDYIRSLKFPSSVFFLSGWFMQNFWDNFVPKPRMISEDTVLFPFAWPPDMRIPLIDIGDAGKYLAPAL
ncbi:hypothetical protein PMG11_05782 [Penicillium brasilianum]|uniref:NmrA-like domain-containing protein n=1 Tax=Penicillium brasilianum TaxID=104259 RepID=A0A0F7TKG4_PENBI|nr:hypothetical protein PMG11_05782 [Penicillium brasilianum]